MSTSEKTFAVKKDPEHQRTHFEQEIIDLLEIIIEGAAGDLFRLSFLKKLIGQSSVVKRVYYDSINSIFARYTKLYYEDSSETINSTLSTPEIRKVLEAHHRLYLFLLIFEDLAGDNMGLFSMLEGKEEGAKYALQKDSDIFRSLDIQKLLLKCLKQQSDLYESKIVQLTKEQEEKRADIEDFFDKFIKPDYDSDISN